MPYLAAGDPDWENSLKIIDVLVNAGADTIEIGLPFTDPVADGPVLQKSFKRVLAQEFTMEKFFKFLSGIKKAHPHFPLLVMGYANIFYRMGFARILKQLGTYNVTGVIIPDIPYEEKMRLIKNEKLELLLQNISWVDFITPTTTKDRLIKICSSASGFLYFVSTKGVTGQSQFSLKPLQNIIRDVRKKTKTPILAGFGIRTAEHAREAASLTDGFIVGSRIHEIIEENLNKREFITIKLRTELTKLLSGIEHEKHLMA